MQTKPLAMLISCAAFLAGCDSHDAVHERTLSESCSEKCYYWAQTDRYRGPVGKDGMRIYIEPSFGDFSYRFEIVPRPSDCATRWIDIDNDDRGKACAHYLVRMRKVSTTPIEPGGSAIREDFRFILPVQSAEELFNVADQMSDRWRGTTVWWTDGTVVSFELHKLGQVRSMYSNAPLSYDYRNPAAWVAAELHRFALAYAPNGQIPLNSDWHSYAPESGGFPCGIAGLNKPDPDGFGVGDDACARSLTDQPSR